MYIFIQLLSALALLDAHEELAIWRIVCVCVHVRARLCGQEYEIIDI